VADVMAGLYAAIAILAALVQRQSTGRGTHIDLALLDVQVATLANVALNYLVSGHVPTRWGNAHANIAPYQVVATADRPIVVAVGNDTQFAKLCDAIGAATLPRDPRYATNDARIENRESLDAALDRALRARPAAAWLAALESAGVPCAPINDLSQVFDDPQVRHRGLRVDVSRGSGTVPLVASPLRISGVPVRAAAAPPRLGEHTESILRERLDLSGDDIAELRRLGVV
jgi:crotonobetainyl-CoA:carnitine CoA-transferase CaiB-like acyl-CoA transferase